LFEQKKKVQPNKERNNSFTFYWIENF